MTQFTLSCEACGSGVDITELHASTIDSRRTFRFRCPACQEAGTVDVRCRNIELVLKGTMSSHTGQAPTEYNSSSANSPDNDGESDLPPDSERDSVSTTGGIDTETKVSIEESPTNRDSESRPESDAEPEQEFAPEPTESESDGKFETDEPVDIDDRETVIDQLAAVQKAGVKHLRDRSEVKRVASAVGHDALLKFLQNADNTEYRRAVREATESAG